MCLLSDAAEVPPLVEFDGYITARRRFVRIVRLYRKQAGTDQQRVVVETEGGRRVQTALGRLDFFGAPAPLPKGIRTR